MTQGRTMKAILLSGFALITGLVTWAAAHDPQQPYRPPADYKDFDLKVLGITWVAEARDPQTGFIVGGKNSTESIRKLTHINGRTIAALEKDMRPGASSKAGFLGPDEKLLDVLAEDNADVVDRLGLTHQQLARHLRLLGQVGRWAFDADPPSDGHNFTYHGRRFRVQVKLARGYQESPFHDNTKANTDVTLQNLDGGKTLRYSLLVPDMVERYGFYEGKGTPYRVGPKAILEVLDFIKPPQAK